jgi:L-fuculose-phosphate aldolase
MVNEATLRKQLCKVSRDLDAKGLVYGDKELAHGQVSARIPNTERMLIKPTRTDSTKVKPSEWVLVDLKDGRVIKGGNPSTETDVHRAIYNARADVGAIVHAHSKFAVVVSTANKDIVPWSDESLMLRGVRVVPRVDYDRERQAKLVVDGLGPEGRCVIIRHHGTMSVGADLEDAAMYCVECERAAEIMYYAMLLDSSEPLTRDEATRIFGKPPLVDY